MIQSYHHRTMAVDIECRRSSLPVYPGVISRPARSIHWKPRYTQDSDPFLDFAIFLFLFLFLLTCVECGEWRVGSPHNLSINQVAYYCVYCFT